jgi:tol-pal system protein YbgF
MQLVQNEQDMKSLISEQSKLTVSLRELSNSVQDSDRAIVARIMALEGGSKAGQGSEGEDCACGDLNTQIARLTEDVRDARYELEIMKEAVAKGTTSTDIVSADEWAAYKKARDVYYDGKFSKAIVDLDKYLANYPNSKYAGHAVYWKGESHYAMGEMQSALKEFQTVISRYPKSWKVEDAQLKIGMCYKNLGELEAAKRELNKLKNDSPNYYRNDLLNRYLNELK